MKHGAWLAGCATLLALSLTQASLSRPSDGLPSSEIKRGLAIAPVQLNLKGKNKSLVARGSYLVNAQGGCNDCHTFPSYEADGNPFEGEPEQINTANYLAGGAQFGPFTSRNITPNVQSGRPANMTLTEFRTTLRTGKDLAGNTLQVMPWPVYGKMTDQDIAAVYEYLRSIPHAEPAGD
jgi:hypothetical protein